MDDVALIIPQACPDAAVKRKSEAILHSPFSIRPFHPPPSTFHAVVRTTDYGRTVLAFCPLLPILPGTTDKESER